jgi:hypothetical protein
VPQTAKHAGPTVSAGYTPAGRPPDAARDPVGNDPKAQELATAHEKVALAIQKHLDGQMPALAPS